MSSARIEREVSVTGKLVGWSIRALGFLVVAYFAWRELPGPLWHWIHQAWWHWGVAPFAYFLLFLAPIGTLVGAGPLIAEARAGVRSQLWWEGVSYVGALAVGVLILWRFLPNPKWWVSWHWWLWGAAVACSAAVSAAGRMFRTVYKVRAPNVRDTFSREWRFNHGDRNAPPALGISMSGGGIRSAAFNLGVLQALHDNGVLRGIDVMSAVSGGSYTMSWYLLQPYYAAKEAEKKQTAFKLDEVLNELFDSDGKYQTYLCQDPSLVDWVDIGIGALMDATVGQPLRAFSAAMGLVGQYNTSSVRKDYRERLQTLFQGLPSQDSKYKIANEIGRLEQRELALDASDFSRVAPVGYRELGEFAEKARLPFFIFNATVLVERSRRHLLWPTAFELTALDIGSDVCGYRTWDDMKELEVSEHLREGMSMWQWDRILENSDRERRRRRWVLMANLAPAISGAAIGLSYFDRRKRSRELKLATWTPFFGNLDLGYLFSRKIWKGTGTLYVSDGGHCENLGAYALIKRQCRKIIIVDAEHEATLPYVFAGYTKLKERLGREMHLVMTVPDIDSYLEASKGEGKPAGPTAAVMTGEVKSKTPDLGNAPVSVIYVKLALDRNRLNSYPSSVSEYARDKSGFPQDPTSNQSFTSEQFIAYRDLGQHVARNLDQVISATTR